MSHRCEKTDCWIESLHQCDQGIKDFTKCPHYQFIADSNGAGAAGPKKKPEPEDGTRLPWTGRALGTGDVSLVSARSPTTLVGLIGPYSSGKTTFLTSMFLHFAKTGEIKGQSFAGSISLQGWENLVAHTKWPEAKGPFFPPHTADNNERVPSLLHLAFRTQSESLNEILFTDAPGEWFSRWTANQDGTDSKGANWISEHATHFVFFIDREALAGEESGATQAQTLALARLLKERRRNRPVIVLWSKSDTSADEEVEKIIGARMHSFFGDHASFEASIKNKGCLSVLAEILRTDNLVAPRQSRAAAPSQSAFLYYRSPTTTKDL